MPTPLNIIVAGLFILGMVGLYRLIRINDEIRIQRKHEKPYE